MINVKTLIDKKLWPYERLPFESIRNKASKTHRQAFPKHRQHRLLFFVWKLDYAARSKSSPYAEKYYL
ncbi:unnamed protein product, partial [Thlaspi arvense]